MRIGLVGAGKIGKLRAQSIKNHPETELVAVMDLTEAACADAASGTDARVFTDLDAFHDVDMDAVFVASPIHVHDDPCLGAFARGRHVLCEKPLSNTVAACRKIVDAAKAADRVLAVGFNLRYYPAIAFVKEAIDAGKIGKLDHLRVYGGHEGVPKFDYDWQYKAPESGGGALMDVGIHMTDVARYLMGEITEVMGVATENVWKIDGSEDNAMAVLRSPDGVSAIYQASWIEWKGYQCFVEAYGSHGMVRGFYAPMGNVLITQDKPGGATKTQKLRYPEIMLREKLKTWQTTALLSFEGELADFLALTRGDTNVRIADGYAGLRSVEIANAIRESGETREVIRLPALGRMYA